MKASKPEEVCLLDSVVFLLGFLASYLRFQSKHSDECSLRTKNKNNHKNGLSIHLAWKKERPTSGNWQQPPPFQPGFQTDCWCSWELIFPEARVSGRRGRKCLTSSEWWQSLLPWRLRVRHCSVWRLQVDCCLWPLQTLGPVVLLK